ncbi:hypothetical protein FQN54_006162 [Arachnomyces sp. PD_36]|nr:hypothetical protein FQN54_006162 [Arachnomyces sp. PD_36]
MANPPPSRARIVPIMAGRKYTAKPKAGSSSASSSRSSLRKKVLKGEKLDPEDLRIQCLDERKLYASPIKGDGNCLFYALSDQLYGTTERHLEIRAQLVEHMRARPDYFIPFVADVGGERRAPRRAAAAEAKLSISRVSSREATRTGQQTKFEGLMAQMEKAGVWGGSAEIQAFCQSYGRDANVYSDSGIQNFTSETNANEPAEENEVVHLAYHSFQHYSSVRAVDGPHTGLPNLPRHPVAKPSDVKDEAKTNGVQETKPTTSSDTPAPQSVTLAEPWKISAISDALPGYDNATIREMLQKCRGDIDNAFAKLLDGDNSVSSSPPSSFTTPNGHNGASATTTSHVASSRTLPASSSRSSSRHSTASKRSADDSEDDDDKIRSPIRRRGRDRKRRILDGVTVGFSVRHDENGVVSFRLRVDPDASERTGVTEVAPGAHASPGVVTRQRGRLLRNGAKEDTPSFGDATDSGTDGTLPPPAESASQTSEVEESGGD